ncbi:MAG: hypothetical protein AAGC57_04075 [Pseudomonadota bacterium]
MSTYQLLLGLGGLAVLVGAIWLRRAQMRFEAGLRAEGDPLADHRGTKDYRQRFTAWLFGIGEREGAGRWARTALTLVWMVALIAAAAWSLIPSALWND